MANVQYNGPWALDCPSVPTTTTDNLLGYWNIYQLDYISPPPHSHRRALCNRSHNHTDPYHYGNGVGQNIWGQTMRSWHLDGETGTGLRSWMATGDVWDYAGYAGNHLPDYSVATPQFLDARSNGPLATAAPSNPNIRCAPTPPLDLSSSDSVLHVYRRMGAPQNIIPESDTEAQAGPRCLWGGRCGALLPNATVQEIRAHLREAHGVPGGDRQARIPCLWDGRCSRSSDFILPGGMGKHVATCHFKIMRRSCTSCGQAFCRQDSLVRHEYLYCPKLRGEKRRKKRPAARRVLSDIPTSA